MVTAQSEHPISHVYLGGARALRTDITANYAIALDGPSGAGKSTVAKIVAKKLGITYLDTGALYRALGLKCLNEGVSPSDSATVKNCLENVSVDIVYTDGIQRVMLDGEDVSGKIRTPEVSMAASAVSAIPYVREKLLGIQRDIAKSNSVILDGRDIGTVVLPSAEFKFFLTASAEIRAKRRFDELIEKGNKVVYEDIYNDVITRDHNDSTRAVAPLKCAYDAEEIVSDNMTAEEVADKIISDVAEVVGL
ncbi:MAG: (d)CMP kinase [Clostridiales bacterium]|nr:(d)CMP kinase [Clostridiales bacterium]